MKLKVTKSLAPFLAVLVVISFMNVCFADSHAPVNDDTPMTLAQQSMVNFFKTGNDLDFESARLTLNRLLRSDSKNTMARVMLASLYQKKTDNLAQILLKTDTSSPKEIFQIGNVLLSSRRYSESIKLYDRVIAKYPKWACPMRHKAEALMNLDRNEEAVNVLKACLKVRKKHFDAYVFLARALVNCKRYAEALTTVDDAVKTFTPDDECGEYGVPEAIMQDCHDLYFDIYTKMGKPEKAEKYKK